MKNMSITHKGYEKLDNLVGRNATLYRENTIDGKIQPEHYFGELKKIGKKYVLLNTRLEQKIEIMPNDTIMC
ncbi:MAG: hypothetical protein V1802_02485 [Candidatus Aenigmatarchaeota archaeon]